MNDETVVKVLQESREAVCKLIAKFEVEAGYHPIANVHIANHKQLVSEIGDAIRYLEDETRTTCKECGGAMVTKKTRFCPECCVVTETPDENG